MLNQKGMATIEMIPILMLFMLLVNFTLGFFGVIHSGILNSIAARNYAFETFRNRANLNYLRDEASTDIPYYFISNFQGFRFHSIVGDGAKTVNAWVATQRPIKFTELNPNVGSADLGSSQDHNQKVRGIANESTNTSTYFSSSNAAAGPTGVDPVWIMTSYGICLDATCGGG